MKKKLILFYFAITIHLSYGQNKFVISNGSKNYVATVDVQKCEDNICSGFGTIKLFKQHSSTSFQQLTSQDLYFFLDKSANGPTTNTIELYGEQSPVIFNDFNFDGNEDLAIRNGNNSSYSGPSYDVYVFNITKKQFVLSPELTDLATSNLGMFQTDKKRKRIITFSKSGCCWHNTAEYEVVFRKGLVKVYELEEDAAKGDDYVYVTTKKLLNNKWIQSTKKIKLKDYYKE